MKHNTIEVLRKHKEWYVRVKASNGRILATSETYSSKQKASNAAKKLLGPTVIKIL